MYDAQNVCSRNCDAGILTFGLRGMAFDAAYQIKLQMCESCFWTNKKFVFSVLRVNKLEHVQATKPEPNLSILKIDYRRKYDPIRT